MMKSLYWITAPESSAATIVAIARQVHVDFPEREEVFANRLLLYPSGCLLLTERGNQKVWGYLLAHPWQSGIGIALNSVIDKLPASPDCFYLHDIALLPKTRGYGMGEAGLAAVESIARTEGLSQVVLVALADALQFWRGKDFWPIGKPADPSYGPDAQYLAKQL